MDQYQIDLLLSAKEMRQREVIDYQVNVDNYNLAISKLADTTDPDMVEFRSHLESLLTATLKEQKKAQLILDVVTDQLNALNL